MSANRPTPSVLPRRSSKGATRIGIIIAIIAVVFVGWCIFYRVKARAALEQQAQAQTRIPVNVTHPEASSANEELVLPGNVQAWIDAPIYARTTGYLKRWLVDIGTPVKSGQLLAEIDTPEVDQQLAQAKADLATAQANNQLAQSTAARWKDLLATDSVSKQDADDKIGAATADAALVNSAQANLGRLQQLQGFKNVVAPFSGIITARNIDIGDLINPGGSGQRELFHIVDTHKLRIYVQLPQTYVASVTKGMTAQLHFTEHPGQDYPAQVVRTAEAVDPNTRTMQVQLESDNPNNTLLPGAYAEVHFQLPAQVGALRLPSNTLLFRANGMQVASVDDNGRVTLKTVALGRDFGKEVEVVNGLAASETVIVNPPDSIATGDTVKIIAAPATPAKDGAAK